MMLAFSDDRYSSALVSSGSVSVLNVTVHSASELLDSSARNASLSAKARMTLSVWDLSISASASILSSADSFRFSASVTQARQLTANSRPSMTHSGITANSTSSMVIFLCSDHFDIPHRLRPSGFYETIQFDKRLQIPFAERSVFSKKGNG